MQPVGSDIEATGYFRQLPEQGSPVLPHIHPLPLARRARHAVDDALDFEVFGEIDETLFPGRDAIKQKTRFDHP